MRPLAETCERMFGLLSKIVAPPLGCIEPQRGNQRRLVPCGILAGLLAQRRLVAFRIEDIIRDLEGRTERAPVG